MNYKLETVGDHTTIKFQNIQVFKCYSFPQSQTRISFPWF